MAKLDSFGSMRKETARKIIEIVIADPTVTNAEVAEQMHVSEVTILRYIHDLKKEGLIAREGSRKTGQWVVLDN